MPLTRGRTIHLDRLVIFAAVAETGGFTAAAQKLGATKTLVSQQIGKLEAELGGMLFARTTRRVRLTEAGERLLTDCAPALRDLDVAVERFGSASARPTGVLRITTAPDYGASVLGPRLAAFAREQPQLRIDLVLSAQVLDLVTERLDLAIRFGWLRDSSLRAKLLGRFEQIVVASPDYLARTATPRRPGDLALHAWVALTLLRTPLSWAFTGPGRRVRKVRMRASLTGNSPEAVVGLVRGGGGISVLSDFAAQDDLRSGRLVRLLDGYTLPQGGIYAVYPAGRQVPAKVRAFLDFYGEAARPIS